MSDATDSRHSSLRDGMLEHLLLGALMREAWLRGQFDFDVLRPVTDAAGYDVVMSAAGATRHVQLKANSGGASTSRQSINTALCKHPSSCIIWMIYTREAVDFDHFLWFGGAPGQPLPPLGDRVAKHTKGSAEGKKNLRPNIRVLNKGQFARIKDIPTLFDHLFGCATLS